MIFPLSLSPRLALSVDPRGQGKEQKSYAWAFRLYRISYMGNVMCFYFSAHRVTSFRDLMHENEDDSGDEEGERYRFLYS